MIRTAARPADLQRWWGSGYPALRHHCGVLLAVNVHGSAASATCPKCNGVWREGMFLGFNATETAARFYFLQAPLEERKRLVWVLSGESLHLASVDYVDGARGFLDDGRQWWAWDYDGAAL